MVDAKTVHVQMAQDDPEYAREYDALEQEFTFMKEMILARKWEGMSQDNVARRMDISQSRVAKI